MAQLSRPYQIALVAIAFLALVWFVALRPHSSPAGSSGTGSSNASASSQTRSGSGSSFQATSGKGGSATPSPVYKGSAPGVKGLSRDVRRAHEAVGTADAQARSLEGASAEPGKTSAPATPTSTAPTHRGAGSPSAKPADPQAAQGARPSSQTSSAITHPAKHRSRAAAIGSELKRGKVVLLLFWNPRSSDDISVQDQVKQVAHKLGAKVAVHYAHAGEVGSFGTVTRNVSVYQTPTLLVIGKHGQVTTITGLTDAFSIEQAIREAKS